MPYEGEGATLKNLDILPVLGYGRNNMPPFESVLAPAQVRDVSSYIMEVLNTE